MEQSIKNELRDQIDQNNIPQGGLKGQTVLVTGAAGFIGNRLCEKLLEEECYVKAILRRPLQNSYPHKVGVAAWNESLITDLTLDNKYPSLFQFMNEVDTIFHLAGIAHTYNISKDAYKQINIDATETLLSLATDANVKNFIYFSSIKAIEIEDLYGHSKFEAEKLVLEWGRKNNKNVCILRPALVYGTGMKGNLLQMLRGIKQGWFPPIPKINNAKSLVWIDDVIDAVILVSSKMDIANQKQYVLAEEKAYSTTEIYDAMRKALKLKPPLFRLPLSVWKAMAVVGDCLQYIIQKRMPINSDSFKRLFASSVYTSELIRRELNWKTKGNFNDFLLKQSFHFEK